MSHPAQHARLQIAARIHHAFQEALGEGIDIAAMLNEPEAAREVLFVCQASGNPELMALGRQFIAATRSEGRKKPKTDRPSPLTAVSSNRLPQATDAPDATGPQDAAWAQGSGFGLGPSASEAKEPPPDRSWRSATQWLRRPKR